MKILKHLLLGLLMAGCSFLPTSNLGGKQTALIKTQIINSGFTTKTTQSVYTSESISHMELRMMAMPSGTVIATKDIPQASLGSAVAFSNLRANTSYRVTAIAYKAAGTNPLDIISTDDASSSVDFSTTTDNNPAIATLKVQLVDRLFNGQGTSSISVTPGGYTTGDPLIGVSFRGNVVSLAGVHRAYDGIGTSAVLSCPKGVVCIGGYLYFVDRGNSRIRRIDLATNAVTTLAGGSSGTADGTGADAQFINTQDVALYNGCLYISENSCIRKLDLATGVVTTIVGTALAGYQDGTGTNAQLSWPEGLAIYNGCLYIADSGNKRIRKMDLSTLEVTTLAGSATSGYGDGTGAAAQFKAIHGLIVHGGYLYLSDENRIRRMDLTTNAVTTLAGETFSGYADGTGTAARFYYADGLAVSDGALLIADCANHRICRMDLSTNAVTTLAGNTVGYAEGTGTNAKFSYPSYLSVYNGDLYVTDSNNNRVRRVDLATNAVTTIAGGNISDGYSDGTGANAHFNNPSAASVYNGFLYVADAYNKRIRKVDLYTNAVTTVAGDGNYGNADGTGTSALFSYPISTAVYGGALYIGESDRIRKMDLATNVVTTFAGGTIGNADGTGTNAQFSYVTGMTVADGCLYITDNGCLIRKVDLATKAVTTIAGQWYDYLNEMMPYFSDGTGTNAQFADPYGIVAYNGSLYVADSANARIRRVNLATNEVTTVAGDGTTAYLDGIGTNARFFSPNGLALFNGCLYIPDAFKVRKMDLATNAVTTLAGGATSAHRDALGTSARFGWLRAIAVDAEGNLFVVDQSNNMIRGIY